MSRVHFLQLFLLPSTLSGTLVIYVALIILAVGSMLYITENQLFYDYLFGVRGVATTLLQAPDSSTAIWTAVSNGPFAYYALLAFVSIITGLTLLAVLQGITKVVRDTSFALRTLNQARIAQKAAIQEMFERLMLRVLGLIVAVLYTILFVNVLLPLVMLLLQQGIEGFDAFQWTEGILYILGSALLLIVSLHTHVILARLYMLRLRIWGGLDVQLAALDHN